MNGNANQVQTGALAVNPGEVLWRHPDPTSSQMWQFMKNVSKKYGTDFDTYDQLLRWSTDNVADFWSEAWHHVGIKASKPFDKVSVLLCAAY